jgi:thiamine-phosphate pyrophosphorylase
MRGLYAIVDPAICSIAHSPKAPLEVARSILTGGCAALQLRDKHADDAAYVQLACDIAALCRQAGVPMIVNDRFWLARAVGAQGVHVGQSDASIEAVRAEVGPAISIGVSTHSLEQARQAEARGAELIGFGPIFPTTTKVGADPVVGLERLAEVCRVVSIPVAAIGGITRENIAGVRTAGARLAAVISALCTARDPAAAARELHSGE